MREIFGRNVAESGSPWVEDGFGYDVLWLVTGSVL